MKGRAHHIVQEKYTTAVNAAAEALPLLVPALGRVVANDELLDSIDGLLLTGSPSNVLPRHYGQPPSRPGTLHDPHRDETTLALVRRCIEREVPLLAICRGFQEMNVAFGGTLHQHVHELPGTLDHRKRPVPDIAVQYAPSHPVTSTVGGVLHRLVGRESFDVNSLHSQGVDRLGVRLAVEARAPDGVIEAFSIQGGCLVRPRDPVASGVECSEGSGLAGDLLGVRSGGAQVRRTTGRRHRGAAGP